jgi:hypothetical protein
MTIGDILSSALTSLPKSFPGAFTYETILSLPVPLLEPVQPRNPRPRDQNRGLGFYLGAADNLIQKTCRLRSGFHFNLASQSLWCSSEMNFQHFAVGCFYRLQITPVGKVTVRFTSV